MYRPSPLPRRSRPVRRTNVALVALTVLLAGCANAIDGQAVRIETVPTPAVTRAAPTTAVTTPAIPETAPPGPNGPKPGVTPAELVVTNDGHTQSDTLAKDTVTDLYDYYGQIFPTDFGKQFTAAKGLISYDSTVKDGPTVCGRSLYQSVNASYNPCADTIVWDRGQLLPDLTKEVGILAAPTVLSHEMGHLVQNRLGVVTDDVLLLEEQADCYAGGYWRWVADGHSRFFDLDQTVGIRMVLSAMMSTGDPVGTTPSTQDAHGSGFDRSYSFTLGYSNGAVRCSKITSAEVKARITETGFTVLPKNFGNVAITDGFIAQIGTVANAYFLQTVKGYRAPTVTAFSGSTGPKCGGAPTAFPVGYCPATNTITYQLAELARIGTPSAGFSSVNGDFSAVLILVSRYGLAAQATTGGSALGNRSGLRGLCYAGSWASWMRTARGPDHLRLSPNDLNKAVYEVLASPLPATDADGRTTVAVIDQIQALYVGVVFGARQCETFYST